MTRLVLALTLFGLSACRLTSHPVKPAELGTPSSSEALLAVIDQPGPIQVETVNSSDWSVDLSGLVNMDHPKAKAAGLKNGLENIQIYFHALRHPERGLYIVDTGVERAQRDDPEHAALGGKAGEAFGIQRMQIHVPLGDYLKTAGAPLRGVFLTHMHADHILGLRDAPASAAIYAGPGEASQRDAKNVVVQGLTNFLLEGKAPLQELQFTPDSSQRFDGVVDVFGDKSLWAIAVPGHTRGSLAFLARTPEGPVLMTGDTCHTAWGWQNEVEPGSFTADREKNARNLKRLEQLVREHPSISVRLGHQSLRPGPKQ
jgi:glyoxylase-like metal-dependent hydrolase (beta-lactamase superfamily II)